MEAQVWTLIALLATGLMGLFFFVATRFDSLGGRIDSLNGRFEERFDSLSARLDEHGRLLHRLVAQATLHGERLVRLEGRFEDWEVRFDGMEHKLDDHLRRHAS